MCYSAVHCAANNYVTNFKLQNVNIFLIENSEEVLIFCYSESVSFTPYLTWKQLMEVFQNILCKNQIWAGTNSKSASLTT